MLSLKSVALYCCCCFVLFMLSCANIMPPAGGPKDDKAPQLKKRNLQDSSLYFKGGKIQFEFDEFLQLKDVENQLVISPLLKGRPKLSVHKKRATLVIPDSLLLPNTTYRVSLGNAVQDLHEGNAAKDLIFTFSTGAWFDSLILNGMITDAETGRADTASWILLYGAPFSDSMLYKQKPLYVQKSNGGAFRFENLPGRAFEIFSLRETNNNFKYDAGGEKISFYEKKVNPADSALFVRLYSFQEKDRPDTNSKRLKNKSLAPDLKKNGPITYTVNIDTLQKSKRSFDLYDSLVISFNDSLQQFDQARIRLFQGDNFDATARIFTDTSMKKIIVKTEWVQDAPYTLTLMKSFAENKQQLQAPAATFTFRTKKESDYGTILISTAADPHKIISLLKDDKVVARKNASDTLIRFAWLPPGNYQVSVLHDANGNGIWDTGNLQLRWPPERVSLLSEAISVKANWGNKLLLKDELTLPRTSLKKKK